MLESVIRFPGEGGAELRLIGELGTEFVAEDDADPGSLESEFPGDTKRTTHHAKQKTIAKYMQNSTMHSMIRMTYCSYTYCRCSVVGTILVHFLNQSSF